MKEGRGRWQLSSPPSLPFLLFPSIFSSKLLLGDSLCGSNSHISVAENSNATYCTNGFPVFPFLLYHVGFVQIVSMAKNYFA
jgi:hypothetical protein